VRTTRETSELRLQTEQMGRSLVDWLRNRHAGDAALQPAIAWLGTQTPATRLRSRLRRTAPAPRAATLLAYAFGWAENMVQAAIKAVPLGQSAGQRILAQLTQNIPQAVDHPGPARPWAASLFPMLAILSAQHEHLYSRLFRS
jgi:urease accessory protein